MKIRLSRENIIPLLLAFLYFTFLTFTMGVHTEHVLLVSFVLACYYLHPKSRMFAKDFSPLLFFAILYDNLRLIPKSWAGPVQVTLPYHLETAIFGITIAGQKMTLCDYFKDHTHWILDLYAGTAYSLHLVTPILFAFFLWIKNRPAARFYIISFFLMNIFAFVTYIAFPAAPPWYVHEHGLSATPDWSTPPSLAGLAAFDQMLHTQYFHQLYSKSAWVFGAIPSMHAGFPCLVTLFSYFYLPSFFPFAAFITGSVWFAAVYLRHHYVIDVTAGILYALIAMLLIKGLKNKKIILSTLIFCFCLSNYGWTFNSSANVPLEDPVYEDIDKLVAAGLIKDVIYGQRPWSRSEFARLIQIADTNFQPTENPISPVDAVLSYSLSLRTILDRLKKQFQDEISADNLTLPHNVQIHPLKRIDLSTSVINDEPYSFISRPLGNLNSIVSPLTAYQEGRHFPEGGQLALETEHSLTVSRFFSFYVRPRFSLDIASDDTSVHAYLQQLYTKFTIPHFELEVGRDTLAWGQTPVGGILLSNNARPLDMIKISNPSPTLLPWVFKYLGPFKYTFFVANLGPEREFPYSYLTGIKLSIKPATFVEFGVHQTIMLGGDGAPKVSIGNALREFIGSRTGDIDAINLSNRETGADFRFFIPQLNNLQFYLDTVFEDDDRNKGFLLAHLANYQTGLYFPLITTRGNASLRLEYHHGSPYFYKHGTFSDGMTLNHRILGDDLGPQANSFKIDLGLEANENWKLHFVFNFQNRSGDIVTEFKDPNRRVGLVEELPDENHYISQINSTYYFKPNMRLLTSLSHDYVHQYQFITGENKNLLFIQTRFQYDF